MQFPHGMFPTWKLVWMTQKNFHTANAMLIYKVQHAKKEDNGNLVSLSYLVYLSKKKTWKNVASITWFKVKVSAIDSKGTEVH